MKILVNASTCSVAGGRSVALNFLRSYAEGDFPYELVAYTPAGEDFEALKGSRLRIEIAPRFVNRQFARPWTDHVWWRRVMARENPDVLFAMGSIAYPTKIPQVVLFHWPYAIYPEREVWERMSTRDRLTRGLRRWVFAGRVRHAACVAAQTETARARLQNIWKLPNVEVIPNAVSLPQAGERVRPQSLPERAIPDGMRALLCLTRYYPHKNLESLLDLGRLIRARGLPFVILTTVSPSDDLAAPQWIESIRRAGLERTIVNLGTVPMEEVPALYRASSGLLLPTLLESFSGTYLESMFFERPVFTSDRDFARDVCGDVAWYFDPMDPHSMLDSIEGAFSEPDELARRVEAGRKRCESFPDWPEVTERYVELLEDVAVYSRAATTLSM